MNIRDAIKTIVGGSDLTTEQSVAVFNEIWAGTATDAQISAFIVALRMKGESVDEITGAATVMRNSAVHVIPSSPSNVLDTCGTGGDGANTFNISTASALVAAGAGAVVAKHGNRSVSSKCGSADVLEALGVIISISPERMKESIDKTGIAFLFAPSLHKAMKYAIGPRKEIGIRTIFNVLGPLTNPALAPAQIMGVFSANLTETMATVLNNMGTRRAFVVHGLDGLDEISLCAATRISEVNNKSVKTYTIQPEDFGFNRVPQDSIVGGTPVENAAIIRDILSEKKGPCRDIVLLNTAFALTAAGIAADPADGIARAAASIDSGAALRKLEALVSFTKEVSQAG